jgi:hypothetical protein
MTEEISHREKALAATGSDLKELIRHPSAEVLLALLDNPALDETQLSLLLYRKDLPAEILAEVARRKQLLKSYRVKRALALHPLTPRLEGLRLLRDLYPMDLVQVTLTPGISPELKLKAEEQVIARLPQLPLGQKITLARRGPARAAAALLAEGHPNIVSVTLDNPRMTEAQILRVLSREKLPAQVVPAILRHAKWSLRYNVRLALVRNPGTPLAALLSFLPHLTASDLRDLTAPGIVPENIRRYLQAEVLRRTRSKQ